MKTVQTLDSNEIYALLTRIALTEREGRPKLVAMRNHLMTLIMLDAGLRVGELVQLLQCDLFMNETPVQTLTVRPAIAKRGRERVIPLSPRTKYAIGKMWSVVWPETTDWWDHFAFYNHDPHDHLTARQVQRIILLAGKDALGRRVTPHMLRHTFATRVLAASNIRVTQQLLGHASIATTQIYTHPNSLDHRNAIAVISGEQLGSNAQKT